MNIFLLDPNAKIAAQMHCDRHCCKMVVESCQILCSVYHEYAKHLNIPYKISHRNHPSCKWSRASRGNFEWLLQHSRALCEEYTNRYGKYHKSQAVLEWCENYKEELIFPVNDIQPFSVAINAEKECRKRINNFDSLPVFQQYRYYYVFDKPFAKWDRLQNTPQWFLDMHQKYANIINTK